MCFEVKYLGIGGRGFPYRKQNRETLHLRRAGTRLSGRHREVRHLRDGLRMERKREKYASWRLSRRPEGGGSDERFFDKKAEYGARARAGHSVFY